MHAAVLFHVALPPLERLVRGHAPRTPWGRDVPTSTSPHGLPDLYEPLQCSEPDATLVPVAGSQLNLQVQVCMSCKS